MDEDVQRGRLSVAATPWYFSPKAAEILFQQTIIVASVFSLSKSFSFGTTVLV